MRCRAEDSSRGAWFPDGRRLDAKGEEMLMAKGRWISFYRNRLWVLLVVGPVEL